MLFRKTVAVYCEKHTKHINTLCGQNAAFNVLKQVVRILTTELKVLNCISINNNK
jgi:hypothetical protein